MPREVIAYWPEALMWMSNFSQRPCKEFKSHLVVGHVSCFVRFSQKESEGHIRVLVHCPSSRSYRRLRSKKGRQCFSVHLVFVTSKSGASWYELDLVPNNDQKDLCINKLTIHHEPEKLKGCAVDILDLGHEEFQLVHTLTKAAQ